MGDTLSVSLDTSKDVASPTLEEEAAKYDNLEASTDDRPEWLPEKFKDPEDLAKAYSELEKKLGSRATEPPEEADDEDLDNETSEDVGDKAATATKEEVREVTEKAGLDFDELSTAYWENGELDAKHYEKLEKAGIPKAIVDQYISGQEALLNATRSTVFNTVGGEESYNSMTEWASENFSKEEISAYNRAVNGADMDSAMMAVKGLKARFDSVNGYEPERQVRGATAKAGSSTYRSIAELQEDMGNPKYWSDAAFRKDVERKLARSDIM